MTVCIAAICNWDGEEEAIVSASDHMISLETLSADNMALKVETVHPDWEAMFAGADISRVDLVFAHARQNLVLANHYSLSEIAKVFAAAYRKARREMIENIILSPLTMTLNQFLKDGLQKLGSENFTALLQNVKGASLGCELLVSGFDKAGTAHIFTVGGDGDVRVYDRTGCWAIGSGDQSSLSSLFFHPYTRLHGVCSAIYHVCEAKFMAEKAIGVGKITLVSIRRFQQEWKGVFEHNIDTIREAWEAHGKPRVPDYILGQIESMIESSPGENATTNSG